MKYSAYARATAIAGAIGTLAGLLLWAAQAADERTPRLIIAAIFALPLLPALIGLLRHRVYTAAWAAMLAVCYLGYALAEHLAAGGSPGLWLTLIASSLLFAGSALYCRLRAREGTAHKPT